MANHILILTVLNRTRTSRWFDKRKGLAAGVIFSGGGVGGAVSPLNRSTHGKGTRNKADDVVPSIVHAHPQPISFGSGRSRLDVEDERVDNGGARRESRLHGNISSSLRLRHKSAEG